MKTSTSLSFDLASFSVLDGLMGSRDFLKIGNTTRLVRHADGDGISYILHDTAIAVFKSATCSLNTGGFVSMTTAQKMNEVLQGHGFVASEKSKWYLYLRDMTVKVNPLDRLEGRAPHKKHRFYNGITFDVNSHEILSSAETVTYEAYTELAAAAGLRIKKPENITFIIDEYDRAIDALVKLYADRWNQDEQDDYEYRADELCERCALERARLIRGIDRGMAPAGGFGSNKEAKLAIMRPAPEEAEIDNAHIMQHLKNFEYEADLIYTACKTCGNFDMNYYNMMVTNWPDRIRAAISQYLRRRLHRGVTNVR